MGYEALACGAFLFFICAGFGMLALKKKRRIMYVKPIQPVIGIDMSASATRVSWEKSPMGLLAQDGARIAIIMRDAGKVVLRLSNKTQVQFIDIDNEELARQAGEKFLRGINEG